MGDETMEKQSLEEARQQLEEAREAERKAYQGISRAINVTERQRGVLELACLEKVDKPSKEQMDRKFRLILESYYLPHILKNGYTVKLDPDFTRFDDPDRDYIEAVFTDAEGKERSVGYNYKVDEDGKNLLIFEKTFENVILKPGDPEKYVLTGEDGETEVESFSMGEVEDKIALGEIVRVEEGYFYKAKDEDGELLSGDTTPIVEDEGHPNVRIQIGDNEQEKYSISKTGQLVRATTNDVTTITTQTRAFSSEPVYTTADEARDAAIRSLQSGETNVKVDVIMESTTMARFSYIPAYITSIELSGLSKKLGKGIEGFDPKESDEENLRRQFDKPIREYLNEKGFYVIGISVENIESDVTENVGFMNTIRTHHLTGGTISVTYIKRLTSDVTIKQGFLGRSINTDPATILAQLPEGSELLEPENIDWKNPKPAVAYITRAVVTGSGSAQTIPVADEKAAENAVSEAQKVIARSLNGGIASGIREAIGAKGVVSTVASARAKLDTPEVTKYDMELSHTDAKYSYRGSCDSTNSVTENKLVSVTTWGGKLLTYVEPTEPIIDKGIPTDDNYNDYIENGDETAILLFERKDSGLRRYVDEVKHAQKQDRAARIYYEKTETALIEAQREFSRLLDERIQNIKEMLAMVGFGDISAQESAEETVSEASDQPVQVTEEAEGTKTAESVELAAEAEGTKTAESEQPTAEAEGTNQEDLMDDEEADAAWERLLMGMPKED